MTAGRWANTYCLHTWPMDDLIAHELSRDCPCQPVESETRNAAGDLFFAYVHSALDGREAREASAADLARRRQTAARAGH